MFQFFSDFFTSFLRVKLADANTTFELTYPHLFKPKKDVSLITKAGAVKINSLTIQPGSVTAKCQFDLVVSSVEADSAAPSFMNLTFTDAVMTFNIKAKEDSEAPAFGFEFKSLLLQQYSVEAETLKGGFKNFTKMTKDQQDKFLAPVKALWQKEIDSMFQERLSQLTLSPPFNQTDLGLQSPNITYLTDAIQVTFAPKPEIFEQPIPSVGYQTFTPQTIETLEPEGLDVAIESLDFQGHESQKKIRDYSLSEVFSNLINIFVEQPFLQRKKINKFFKDFELDEALNDTKAQQP